MSTSIIHIDSRSGEARLATSGVSIWALIAYLQKAVEGDIDRAVTDYEIPVEAVEAALDYYDQHRAIIDARILLNTAPSAAVMAVP